MRCARTEPNVKAPIQLPVQFRGSFSAGGKRRRWELWSSISQPPTERSRPTNWRHYYIPLQSITFIIYAYLVLCKLGPHLHAQIPLIWCIHQGLKWAFHSGGFVYKLNLCRTNAPTNQQRQTALKKRKRKEESLPPRHHPALPEQLQCEFSAVSFPATTSTENLLKAIVGIHIRC